jgi:hypothetical protein
VGSKDVGHGWAIVVASPPIVNRCEDLGAT